MLINEKSKAEGISRNHSKRKGGKNCQLTINIVCSITSLAVNYGINFFLTPFIKKHLGIEANGFISLATTFISYINLLAIALNSLSARYIAIAYHKQDSQSASVYFSSVLVANIVLSIIVFIPAITLIFRLDSLITVSDNLVYDVKLQFVLVLLSYIITTIGTVYTTATFIKNRLDISSIRNTISLLLRAALLVGLFTLFAPRIWYAAIANLTSSLFLIVTNKRLTQKYVPEIKYDKNLVKFSAVKELVSNGIWQSVCNAGVIMNTGLDLLIANIMIGETAMGEVAIGKNFSSIFNTLMVSINNAFRPKETEYYAKGDMASLLTELDNAMKLTSCACNVVVGLFLIYGLDFVKLWLSEDGAEIIWKLATIVFLGDLAVGVVQPLVYTFILTNNVRLASYPTLAMGLVNASSMYLLLKYTSIGVYSIVLTTLVLNVIVSFTTTPLLSSKCLKISKLTFYPRIALHLLSFGLTSLCMLAVSKIMVLPTTWLKLLQACIPTFAIGGIVAVITTYSPKQILILTTKAWRRLRN